MAAAAFVPVVSPLLLGCGCDPVYFDPARGPRVDAGQVVEDQRDLVVADAHVAVLARLGQLVAADDKGAAVEDKADGVGVRLAVGGDGGQAQQPLRLDEGALGLLVLAFALTNVVIFGAISRFETAAGGLPILELPSVAPPSELGAVARAYPPEAAQIYRTVIQPLDVLYPLTAGLLFGSLIYLLVTIQLGPGSPWRACSRAVSSGCERRVHSGRSRRCQTCRYA